MPAMPRAMHRAMHRGYSLFSLRSISRAISPLVKILFNGVVIKIIKSVVTLVHLLLLSILKNILENLKPAGTAYQPRVCRSTGKRHMKQYRDKFVQYFPALLAEITRLSHGWDRHHLKEMIEYNVMGGKLNRGLMSVVSYCHLVGGRPLTEEEETLVFTLGWCMEMMQGAFLIADDIMDHSLTRRGKPCWYKQEYIQLTAIIDLLRIEGSIYKLLENSFQYRPYYIDLLNLFHLNENYSEVGQALDLLTAPVNRIDFTHFTMERYQTIVKYKTSYYTFCLPVRAAMYMAGINDKISHAMAENILIEIGEFFQIQDDFIDCFGDPKVTGKVGTDIENNKCSWLIVQALAKANPEQRALLEANYGRFEPPSCAMTVREIYDDLGIKQVFYDYEEGSYQRLCALVDQCSHLLPADLFLEYIEKLYKRKI